MLNPCWPMEQQEFSAAWHSSKKICIPLMDWNGSRNFLYKGPAGKVKKSACFLVNAAYFRFDFRKTYDKI